jgi:hypothetical protein
MSFQINLKKNEQGTYDITTTSPETLPDQIQVTGHVETISVNVGEEGFIKPQVVDLAARADGLLASASRRENALYMQ